MAPRPPIYGLIADFADPNSLLAAANAARQAGFRNMDGYAPFAVEGLAEALGFRRTRMPFIILMGGITGCLGGYLLQYYAAVISYPVNIGGRPLNSWVAFIPVTFEMTILVAALTTVLGMLALNGLPAPYHPLFNVPRFDQASRDRFFLCIEATDPRFDREETRRFLVGLNAQEVSEVPH